MKYDLKVIEGAGALPKTPLIWSFAESFEQAIVEIERSAKRNELTLTGTVYQSGKYYYGEAIKKEIADE